MVVRGRVVGIVAVLVAARAAYGSDPPGMAEVKPPPPVASAPSAPSVESSHPPGMVEVISDQPSAEPARPPRTPRPPWTLGATDEAVIASPFERNHRLGLSVGSRMICLDVRTPGFCVFGMQLGFDFRYGNVHAGAIGTPSSGGVYDASYVSPYGGIELGSRYYYFSLSHGRRPVSFGVAARASAEFMGILLTVGELGNEGSHPSYFGFATTAGPNLLLLVGSNFGVYARAAVGVAVRAEDDRRDLVPTAAGFAIDAGLGVEARF